MLDLTVILTAYRRGELLPLQVAAIRRQSLPAKQIWLWANEANRQLIEQIEGSGIDRVVCCSDNAFVHARFALALTANTEYVAIFDDDTIPGDRWFENCLTTICQSPGILGTAGVRLVGPQYRDRVLFGWHRPCSQAVEVDLVGHAWFLPTAWVRFLFAEPAVIGTNGEDIELSARAWRSDCIRSYCPPHPANDKQLWGSLRGTELGSDSVAASRHLNHLAERDQVVRHEIEAGWHPLFLRQATPFKTTGEAPPSSQKSDDDAQSVDDVLTHIANFRGRVLMIGHRAQNFKSQLSSRADVEAVAMRLDEFAERFDATSCNSPQTTAGVFGSAALNKETTRQTPTVLDRALTLSFDAVVCDFILERAKNPRHVLARVFEFLRPGGEIITTVHNARHHAVIGNLLRGKWPFPPQQRPIRDQIRFFTRRELEKLLFRARFNEVTVEAVPNSDLTAWREGDNSAEVRLGPLHIGGLSRQDGEEFFAGSLIATARRPNGEVNSDSEEYLATAPTSQCNPAFIETSPTAPKGCLQEGENTGSTSWAGLAARFPWPHKPPSTLNAPLPLDPLPIPPGADGWLADGAREALLSELKAHPKLVLELGAWLGLSARFMLDTCPGSRVITVDHFRGSPEHMRHPQWSTLLPRLYETFLTTNWSYRERLMPLKMTTTEGLQTVARHGLEPDLVFFDAEHRDDAVTADLVLCHQLFPRAVLLGDDYDDPEVQRAIERFARQNRLKVHTYGVRWRAWKLIPSVPIAVPTHAPELGLTSIVIVTLNQLGYSRQCLESIRYLTDEPYELIIVDNGSTDGSVEYFQACQDVQLICNPDNRGFPAAANQGIQASRGQQVLLLNNDVVVTTGWLRRLLAPLGHDPHIGLVGPCLNFVGSAEQQIPVSYQELAGLDGFAWEWGKQHHGEMVDTDRLVGFCLLISREVIDRIGLLDERFGIGNFEDDDYCRRALKAEFRAVVARDAFIHHFGHRTFAASNIDLQALLRNNETLYRAKWRDAPQEDPTNLPLITNGTAIAPPRFTARLAAGRGLALVSRDPPRPPKLSLCMIVRDNANTIRASLESIRPFVDEMIVVDTGSTDKTPAICQELGATVFHFPWCDSFAAARNESLNHARGEWIFWMDSDDTIDHECGQKLRGLAYMSHPRSLLGFVLQVHCPGAVEDGSANPSAQNFTIVDHVKLFRNRPDLRFEGRIHEQIAPAIRRAGGDMAWTDIHVVHSGADRSLEGRRRKLARDLRLLDLELKEQPNHPFTLFNLGMTYADAGQYEEAVRALTQSLGLAQPHESQVRKAYGLLVGSLCQLERFEEAWQVCDQGLSHYPLDPELHFRRGILAQHMGRLQDAEREFLEAISARDGRHFSSIDRGVTGYKARHNLAVVYRDMARYDQAESQWRQAIAEAPDFVDGWRGLGDILVRQRKYSELELLSNNSPIIEHSPGLALLWQSQVLRAKGEIVASDLALRRAIDRAGQELEPLRAYCQLAFESADLKSAETGLRELVAKDPDDAVAHYNLATVCLRNGRFKEASTECRESIRLNPKYAAAYVNLGYALEHLEHEAEATSAWESALKIDPNCQPALVALSRRQILLA